MESTIKHDDKLFGLLASIKETFWLEYQGQGIADSEIKRLWGQQYVDRLAPVLSVDAPPSSVSKISNSSCERSTPTTTPNTISQLHSMPRTRTETYSPRSPPMDIIKARKSRKRASSFVVASSDPTTRSLRLPSSFSEFESGHVSVGRKMQRTASGSRTLPVVSEALVLEDPGAYLEKTGVGSYRPPTGSVPYPSLPIDMTLSSFDNKDSLSPHSGSFHQPIPLTPESATIPNESFLPPSMSRQDSLGLDFRAGFAMFRLDSQASNTSECAVVPPAPSFLPQLKEQPMNIFEPVGLSPSLQPATSRSFASYEFGVASQDTQCYSKSPIVRPDGSTKMDERSKSQKKAACDTHIPSGERLLKPKMRDASEPSASQRSHPTISIESQRGVLGKYQISKTPYTRPSREKIKCSLCDKQPEGFRGDHELRRHQKLHHSNTRTGWICVDRSEEGNMLGGCKHCRGQKVYGAYYNAAAHLRRVHFHPRKEGRKARGSVSRAGKGGGDDPPMEELKRWMKQVEVKETSNQAVQVLEDGELPSEDHDQSAPFNDQSTSFNDFTQDLSSSSADIFYPFTNNLGDFAIDATNFALTSSGCPWPSEETWSTFRNSYAFEESNIFDLELHCEV